MYFFQSPSYTIPSAFGTDNDTVTIINGGSSGNITVSAGSGVTLYNNGTAGNIVIGPYSMRTIVRNSASIWIG